MSKKKNERRQKINTITEQTRVASKSNMVICPPDHMVLNEKARIYFDEIIDVKAKADWNPHDVSVAAMLARLMAELDINQQKMEEEGTLVKGAGGKVVVNPRRKLIAEFFDKINSTRRSLGIYSLNAGSDKFDELKRRMMAKELEDSVASASDDDGLLAQPVH